MASISTLPSSGFSTIGTPASAARWRTEGLGWLVIRMAVGDAPLAQPVEHFEPVQFRQMIIDHEAPGVGDLRFTHELVGARIIAYGEAFDFQREFQ